MTKKQLFDGVMSGEVTGKAIFWPILMHFAARFNHTTYGKFASDYKVFVASNIKSLDYFELDMVSLISDPYRETSAFGAKIEFQEEGVPKCLNLLVQTTEDVKALKNPDVYKAERTLDRINGAKLFSQKLKGNVPVMGWIEGPLAEACDLAGVSEMLIKLMTDPDFSNLLMDKCMITAREFAKAQVEAGCDIIGMGDAICSQIDNYTYDTLIKARHIDMVEYIHSLGARVKLHICGDINHLLPSIKDLGCDIVDIDWQVDLDHAYDILGTNVMCAGNINPVTIMQKTANEIAVLSKILVEKEKGKKFNLSGGCEIAVTTPPENLLAMRKASNYEKT